MTALHHPSEQQNGVVPASDGHSASPVSHRGKAAETLADLVASGSLTCTLRQARSLLDIGEDLAYELAESGEFPGILRLGRLYKVSIPILCRVLGVGWPPASPFDGELEDLPQAADTFLTPSAGKDS
jgi:hypothetical protein